MWELFEIEGNQGREASIGPWEGKTVCVLFARSRKSRDSVEYKLDWIREYAFLTTGKNPNCAFVRLCAGIITSIPLERHAAAGASMSGKRYTS